MTTALELRRSLLAGERTVTEVVTAALEAPDVGNAIVTPTPELALRRASELDAMPPDRRLAMPLFGIPTAYKDLYPYAGVRTAYGSRAFADNVATETDPVLATLDAAGAVCIGKSATPEFGMTNSGSSALTGDTTIPGHPHLSSGGSSAGAAASVASGRLTIAHGSDAGGSIRIPAAACGLVGLKPGRGRLPHHGGASVAGGLATSGALATTVADAALFVDALIGDDHHETATRAPRLERPLLESTLAAQRALTGTGRLPGPPLRVGMLTGDSPWASMVDTPASREALLAADTAARLLGEAGHDVTELAAPDFTGYADAFTALWQVNSTLAPMPDDSLMEPLTRWLRESGRSITGAATIAALGTLTRIERRVIAAFDPFDVVITPTTALPPRAVGWWGDDPLGIFRRQCQYTPWTSLVNVAGLPALSMPVVGIDDGLTMSVQLIGRPGGEGLLVELGAHLELLTGIVPGRP